MQHYYALLLAGGGGTRLWPMSRKARPKQVLSLVEDRSMFRASIDRLDPVFTPDRIYISTTRQYVDDLRAAAPEIPPENFIAEPSARNNTAAIGLAIAIIQAHDPEAVIAMMPTDHFISKRDVFLNVLRACNEIALEDNIVTLGISPSFPSTGFGYIQQGAAQGEVGGFTYHRATRFTEKPDVVRATQFLASGDYSWNSGMFIWSAQTAMNEFERQQNDMHGLLQKLQPTVGTPEFDTTLDSIWEQMPSISIDYAVMEQAQQMMVIPVDIGWSDVGSWASLFDVSAQDEFGNIGKGADSESRRIVLDTRDTLIYTDKLAVAIGVENIIVVETDDVVMVCARDRAQNVRDIVKYLRENDMADYL